MGLCRKERPRTKKVTVGSRSRQQQPMAAVIANRFKIIDIGLKKRTKTLPSEFQKNSRKIFKHKDTKTKKVDSRS